MAERALLLSEGGPDAKHAKLVRVLDFFGVPWKTIEVSGIARFEGIPGDYVVFGSATSLAAALNHAEASGTGLRWAAMYAYASRDNRASERALQSLCGIAGLQLNPAPEGTVAIRVSSEWPDLTGPMTGVEFRSTVRKEDAILSGLDGGNPNCATLIVADGAPVFARLEGSGVPLFVCASSYIVDIEQPVGSGFHDVRNHFCSVVPLVLMIQAMFRGVAWRPQETGACLIIDDPLLRPRYGACNFGLLRDLMQKHNFTTSVAFIPWNWRRTLPSAGELFRSEFGFSVSIHGCDHTKAEFGEMARAELNERARLALSRMRQHELRTGIHHDPVMVFPQGVFSSVCPDVLKRNGFIAAVNTETTPVDADRDTRIRDVWDIAIMRYGSFPIFTRRYPHHGMENFAFDLLLGKSCLIVSHHDYFKAHCADLLQFLEKLQGLHCNLRWRSLGDVIRYACRYRKNGRGITEIEMYGTELMIDGVPGEQAHVRIRKRENAPGDVAEVRFDGQSVAWLAEKDAILVDETVELSDRRTLKVLYRNESGKGSTTRPLHLEVGVAVRRMLSEVRDDYVSKKALLGN